MALYSFTNVPNEAIRGKVFMADSCFLIKCSQAGEQGKKLAKFKSRLLREGGLGYNVIVKNEIFHYLRSVMVIHALNENKIEVSEDFKRKWTNIAKGSTPLKDLCFNGYASIFREIFGHSGENLKVEVDKILFGCTYYDGKNTPISWEPAFNIMATYGLDSSDAMILNMAVQHKTFSGLVTADADFRICGDLEGFDIVTEDSFLKYPKFREWQKTAR